MEIRSPGTKFAINLATTCPRCGAVLNYHEYDISYTHKKESWREPEFESALIKCVSCGERIHVLSELDHLDIKLLRKLPRESSSF